MKKFLSFIRSMRFGIILLLLIALCSVAGTVIPQGREIAWYAQTYRSFHGTILLLQLNKVFQSWYFILLLVLLGVNLILCSATRLKALLRSGSLGGEKAARLPDQQSLTKAERELVLEQMRAQRCREEQFGDTAVFTKHALGRYGSFITHLSILLTLIFGALALYTPTVVDRDCMPGESISLDDGTQIHVYDFQLTDETGRLDYLSRLQITLPDGRESGEKTVKVNYPVSFGPYKIFQQSFGTAGSLTVENLENGAKDDFTLTELSFLSLDGRNGLWYEVLYPDYIKAPSGEITLFTITEGSYPNPIYQVQLLSDGQYTPVLAVPGDQLEVMGLRFTFNPPVEYPGLRIKHVSTLFNALLIASFCLMILSLYITFFLEPVLVKVGPEGYAVGGPKPERPRLELEELLSEQNDGQEEENT